MVLLKLFTDNDVFMFRFIQSLVLENQVVLEIHCA